MLDRFWTVLEVQFCPAIAGLLADDRAVVSEPAEATGEDVVAATDNVG